jgi:hypothetical protein
MKSNTQLCTGSVRIFVIPFYYGSGSVKVCDGSAKVKVSTVPVPQHWQRCSGSEERLMRMELVGMVRVVRIGLGQSIAALIIHLTSLLQVQSARFCFSLTLTDNMFSAVKYRYCVSKY